MDFLELAKARYSVRKFSAKKVDQEKIQTILEAGRAAPTAVNYQPHRILVIDSDEGLEKLRNCTRFHFHAPLAMLVCYDTVTSWKHEGRDIGEIDASIVTTHLMLAAADLGLGTTWVGHFSSEQIQATFEIPSYLIPVALLPMGYPADTCVPHAFHSQRLDLEQTVFYNTFEGIQPGEGHMGKH